MNTYPHVASDLSELDFLLAFLPINYIKTELLLATNRPRPGWMLLLTNLFFFWDCFIQGKYTSATRTTDVLKEGDGGISSTSELWSVWWILTDLSHFTNFLWQKTQIHRFATLLMQWTKTWKKRWLQGMYFIDESMVKSFHRYLKGKIYQLETKWKQYVNHMWCKIKNSLALGVTRG